MNITLLRTQEFQYNPSAVCTDDIKISWLDPVGPMSNDSTAQIDKQISINPKEN